ncbi:Ig-like domain-containing protein [Ferrimonas balearica]|uniref:Ig-like domain-containing protein n=1 Tax=Ferrimonas balearica TaxID=44012 RepID=UPI001C99A068|nr:Ig-like domain-containing protein [Ferrimonas balearica]MBY5923041.1 tandem-95 repeat protein [Ferrimonas balearica]
MSNGNVVLTPPADFNGSQDIPFTATDPGNASASGTITVIVDPVNDAPVANNLSRTIAEGATLTVPVSELASDVDGDALTLALGALPEGWSGSVSNGNVVLTPPADFNGSQDIPFTATDPGNASASGTITVIVDPVNDAPVANNLSRTIAEGATLTVPVSELASDVDGDALTLALGALPEGWSGSVSNGNVVLTPPADFNGSQDIPFTATDPGNASASGTITVIVDPVNDAPVANNISRTIAEGATLTVPVSELASDVDGDALTLALGALPEGWSGSVSNGNVVLTPPADFNGSQDIPFTATDPDGESASGIITVTVTPVNDAPVAMDDSYTLDEGATLVTTVAEGVRANDSDIDHELTELSVSVSRAPTHGTLTLNADGSFSYEHDGSETTTDSFAYQLSDGELSSTATVSLTINPGNDAPVAVDDSYTLDEGASLTVVAAQGVRINDSDADHANAVLTVTVSRAPAYGTLTLKEDGGFSYEHNGSETTSDSFVYQLSDGEHAVTATVNLIITAINDAPVAVADSYTLDEGATLTVTADQGVRVNDSDPDHANATLSVSLSIPPAHGSLTLNPDGSFIYQHDGSNTTADRFTYELSDGELSAAAIVDLVINADNSAPVAVDDEASVREDESVQILVLDNDTHSGSGLNPASVQFVQGPQHGTVTINAGSGVVTYTPNANFAGTDSFTYGVQDNDERSSEPATVWVSVVPVNDPPVAVNDTYDLLEDGELLLTLLNNDRDPDGDDAPQQESIRFLSQPEMGRLEQREGQWYYVPELNQIAAVEFEYQVADAEGSYSNTAQVFVRIESVNDAPVARPDTASTDEDTPLPLDLLVNDEDVDGELLPTQVTITVPPTMGTLSQDDNGDWFYTPSPNASGQDSFEYWVVDEQGLASESVVVTITINPVNDLPVAVDDTVRLPEDGNFVINVLGNDWDIDGALVATSTTVVTQPEQGTVVLDSATGFLRYQANVDYAGEDRFQYRVQDDAGAWSNDAWVLITVEAVNDAPLANDDRFEISEDQGGTLVVLGNDSDVDGQLDLTTIELKDLPTGASFEVQPDGTITIQPHADFSGELTLSYRVADDEGVYSEWAEITVVILPVNDAPEAVADQFELTEGGVLDALVTNNDFDVDGDAFTAVLVTAPQYGQLTLNDDGSFRYQHDGGEQSQDQFQYRINDGKLDSGVVSVTLTILGANDAPQAADDLASTQEDQPVTVDVLANDSDPDGDVLTVTVTQGPKLGGASVTSDGRISYQPFPNLFGRDTLEYQVDDGNGGVAKAMVTIDILAVNDAPNAEDDQAQTQEDQAVSIDVLNNDSDSDGGKLTLTLVSQPSHGEAQVLNGQIHYQPAPDYHGEDSFSYAIRDDADATDQAQVFVTVKPVNDPPVAQDDRAETSVREPVMIAVLENDSDVDEDALTVVSAGVDYGQVEVLEGRTLRFTPLPERAEPSRISYRISDGQGGEASAQVQVTVTTDNRAPVAKDDEVVLAKDQWQATIPVLDNDSDPDGDALTIIGAAAGYGEVIIQDGALVWSGDSEMPGSIIIEYRISDAFGAEDSAIVLVLSDDAFRPVVTAPADVWVDARGLFTKVDLGTATAVDRFGTPLPVSLVDGVPFYQPGDNTAYWQACDDEGRCGTAAQKVYVRPLISLAKDQVVLEGQSVSVEVVMNGPHFEYPVVVPYTLSGTLDDNEHTLIEGELLIEAGTSAFLTFETFEDGIAEADETLVVHLDGSVNPGNKRDHQVTITEGNLPPELALSAAQDSEPRLVASQELGAMIIAATLTDPNEGDQHQWQWHHDSMLADLDVTEERFEFDPAEVDPGLYTLTVEAWDQEGLTDIASITIEVVEALAPLEPGADSDGDLIPDVDEGYVDRDFDGIPDYRDQVVDECNVLPETGDNWDGYIVEADPAVCLRIGLYTTNGASGGAQVFDEDIGKPVNDLVPDTEAVNVGGIFDFIAYKLPEIGQTLQVVLPQRLAIPANAVYRKFLPREGWVTLVEDGDNLLHSAPGEPGFCPPPGGDVWTPGLTEGHWCVQLTLKDGGRYDADELTNGSVTDPGGVAVMLSNNRPPLANADATRVRDGKLVIVPVLENDSDPDADPLSVVAASAALGQVSINDDNTLSYQAPEGYLGEDTLSYSISDGQGGSAQATVAVEVYLNRLPVAVNDAVELYNNDTALVRVMSNDSDADGDVLSVVSASVDIGTLSVEADGQLRYQPPQDYIGPAVATYTISDGEGGEASAEVQFSVLGKQLVKTEGGSSGSLNALGLALLALLGLGRRRVLPWLALVLGVSAPALAEEKPLDPLKPWFVTGNLSWASSNVSKSDLNGDLADAGLDAQVLSLDKERLGWGAGLGYRFTERWFVEAGYLNIDEVDLTIEGVFQDPAAFFDAVEHVYPESGHGPYAQIGYRLPLSERWGLTGKVGAFFWEGDYESVALNTNMGTGSDNPDGTDLLYGVTLDYRVTRDWLASLQLQRVEFDRYPAMLLGFNVSYHFGGSDPAPIPVVLDSDGDGVVDPQDACPDTPMTHAVDTQGCTLWRALEIELEGVVLFANDSAEITTEYESLLADLSRHAKGRATVEILIEAHASAPASRSYNQALSERRAEAVKGYLVALGVDAGHITLVAQGENAPAVEGNTEQAYAQNRRAVVTLEYRDQEPVPRG